MQTKLPPAIFIMGPTASGKTGLAVELHGQLPIELISVDSALVYKGMDIGTAKPDTETLRRAPHHLIDIIHPTESYSAAQFRKGALGLMAEITNKGKIPVLVGGTMLYFNALQSGLNGLPEANQDVRLRLDEEAEIIGWPAMHQKLAQIDPSTAGRLQPTDSQRIQRALEVHAISGKTMSSLFEAQVSEVLPYNLLKISLVPSDRSVLHQRIAQRFDLMLDDGFIEEVKSLISTYPTLNPEMSAMRCVGYRQALQYLAAEDTVDQFREKAIAATRQLAKRQLTWLRGMDDTLEVDCLKIGLNEEVLSNINQFIKR